MSREFYIEQIKRDLIGLAEILEDDKRYEANDEEKPDWQKEIDGETSMFDCDAPDCKFWNEGFKSNCMLHQIEINAQHGCAQYQAKENKGDNNE